MADPSLSDADDIRAGPDRDSTGMPRWVKVFGIIALVLALLFVVMLVGGGRHGPARHRVAVGEVGGETPPATVTESGQASSEAGP